MTEEELMQAAVDAAHRGIDAGQSPFGCAIAHAGELVVACHNVVWKTTDITAHAEVTAIREACQRREEILLHDCVVATTCEPCPMCMAALHWARVDHVYFGATIADAASAGFNELTIPAQEMLERGGSSVKLQGEVMREECRQLFARWQQELGNAY